jgi:hypothetical protein
MFGDDDTGLEDPYCSSYCTGSLAYVRMHYNLCTAESVTLDVPAGSRCACAAVIDQLQIQYEEQQAPPLLSFLLHVVTIETKQLGKSNPPQFHLFR